MKNFAITGVAGYMAPRHHTRVSKETLGGRGFGLDAARPTAPVGPGHGLRHPALAVRHEARA